MSRSSPSSQEHYRVWQRLAPLGLLLVGAGLAVTTDAATRRANGVGAATWVGEGTGGLVLVNAGLSVFGEAVKRRALHDVATGAAGGRHR